MNAVQHQQANPCFGQSSRTASLRVKLPSANGNTSKKWNIMERIHRSIPLDSRETGVEGNMLKRLNCSSRLDHLGVRVLLFPADEKRRK